MNWDTFYQLTQFCDCDYPVWLIPYAPTGTIIDSRFSDHHPIFDTLVFGCFAQLSDMLTGSWNNGVFAFTLVQSAATAFSFSYAISFMVNLGVSKKHAFLVLAFLAVIPIYPIYAATMVKDSLFSWLYILYFVWILKLIKYEKGSEQNKGLFLGFIILCVLLALTKKTGVYLVALTSALLVVFFRQYWKQLICSAVLPVLITLVLLPCVIFPIANVAPGGKQEVLAPLFQQTARYVMVHSGQISESESDAIDRVLDYETLSERYKAQNADPVKFMWNYDCTADDLIDFLYVYVKEGFKDPWCYFEAWFATASGYLSPTEDGAITIYTTTGSSGGALSGKISLPESAEPIRSSLAVLYSEMASIPGLSILFSLVLYCFWIPIVALLASVKSNRELLPLFIPTALSLVFCIITPVVHARYALPLIYTAPLLVVLATTPSLLLGSKSKSEDLG